MGTASFHCIGSSRPCALKQFRATPYKAGPPGLGEMAVPKSRGLSLCDCTPGYHTVAPLGLRYLVRPPVGVPGAAREQAARESEGAKRES